MINVFDNTDICYKEKVISLWIECFNDSREYIEFFLDNCPGYICIADEEDDRIVSMLFLLNGSVKKYKCKYLYAACTCAEYRKHGIMKHLIEYSEEYCKIHGYDAIFLVPANDTLYGYYKRLGFIECFYRLNLCIEDENELNCGSDFSDQINQALAVKSDLLKDIDCFQFDKSAMEYTCKEHLFNGGKVLSINNAIEKTVAFFNITNNNIYIKELLSDKGLKCSMIGWMIKNYNAENVYIQCPIVYNTKDIESLCTKCGMIYPLNNNISDYIIGQALYAGMYLD